MAKQTRSSDAKILFAEPHRNENAAISYGAAIVGVIHLVRQEIAMMAERSEPNEYALGAMHALRKLCEGEKSIMHIHRAEVEEWRGAFFDWFARVGKPIAPELLDTYISNVEDDFRVILAAAGGSPVLFSRSEVNKRYIKISFASKTELDHAKKVANEKYPVRLGSALHNYIESSVKKLFEGP